ncbi:MAG: aldo/keto reductase [Armatimonadota bacterium]|nr:aldo/keto reductase [Armatimonadota bacterium]
MEYRQLGRSGMRVSKLCLGTMSYAARTDEDEAHRIMSEAADAGVNFFDTADVYRRGGSEEFIGRWLADTGRRDEIVLATKAVWKMGDGPNHWGASRQHLTRAVEASLRRLQTDRVDLYYLHVVDPTTPVNEILETLDDLQQQGKILYIGTSKWPSSLVCEMRLRAQFMGQPQVVVEQSPYNLLDRRLENEMAWLCLRQGIGLCTFGPLCQGILSGKYHRDEEPPEDARLRRAGPDHYLLTEGAYERVEQLRPLAEGRDCTLAELSIAWVMQQPFISSAIVGCRTVEHLRSAVRACEVELSDEELQRIDEICPPGSTVSDYYDRVVWAHARAAANEGNWRAHELVDSSRPPGTQRRSLD